jgi:hypothetical protein
MFCFHVRKRISASMDDGRALSERAVLHTQQCSKCAQFLEQQSQIKQKLCNTSGASGELPSFLHGKVMNAVRSEGRQCVCGRRLLAYAGAACLLLAVGLSISRVSETGAVSGYAQVDDWEGFQSLETNFLQMEQLISGGPDLLTQSLDSEIRLLEEDILAVAEKLEGFIGMALLGAPEESG